MRILITGASSFLGGHVRREAAAAGHAGRHGGPVRGAGVGVAPPARPGRRRPGPDRRAARLRSRPTRWSTAPGRRPVRPEVLAAANVTAVHALLTAMLGTRSAARLVHIGSAAEYGRHRGQAVAEQDPPRPASAYGATKLAGTALDRTGPDGRPGRGDAAGIQRGRRGRAAGRPARPAPPRCCARRSPAARPAARPAGRGAGLRRRAGRRRGRARRVPPRRRCRIRSSTSAAAAALTCRVLVERAARDQRLHDAPCTEDAPGSARTGAACPGCRPTSPGPAEDLAGSRPAI